MIKVLSEITSSLNKTLVVSIAAGVARPACPRWAMTGKLSAPCRTPLVNADDLRNAKRAGNPPEDTADVLNIFPLLWRSEVIAEPMIHPVVGVSGSSPAYVFMFIEAMADAAVLGDATRPGV